MATRGKMMHTVRFTVKGVPGIQEETYHSWTDIVVCSSFKMRWINRLQDITILDITVEGRTRKPDGVWLDVGLTRD